MSISSAFVLFATIWFMTLYMVLPLFVRSQEEAGEVEPGTPPGAPNQSLMKKKLIWTTGVAMALWLVAFLVIESNVITREMIESVFSRPD